MTSPPLPVRTGSQPEPSHPAHPQPDRQAASAAGNETYMPLGLYTLALAGFGIGIVEFVIVGLLPDIAADYAVTEATAGFLVSGYAIAVAIGLSWSPP